MESTYSFFLLGIGVVEAQIGVSAELVGEAEVEADGFGVADVQVAVGLGRKAGLHASVVLVGLQVFEHDVAMKLEGRGSGAGLAPVSGSDDGVVIIFDLTARVARHAAATGDPGSKAKS